MKWGYLIKAFPGVFERYWNARWDRNEVSFTVCTGVPPVKVRSVLNHASDPMRLLASAICSNHSSSDQKALQALIHARRHIKYVSDMSKHGKPEYWQQSHLTHSLRTGDCEDGAIWIHDMLLLCGVEQWRFKLCCGYVDVSGKPVGHAYVIYLADDFKWYVLDWCYWFNTSKDDFLKVPHCERKEYEEIWFTFNAECCWSQHSTNVDRVWKRDF